MTTVSAAAAAAALTDDQARRLHRLLYRTTHALGERCATGISDTYRVSYAHVMRLARTTELHCAIGDRLPHEVAYPETADQHRHYHTTT